MRRRSGVGSDRLDARRGHLDAPRAPADVRRAVSERRLRARARDDDALAEQRPPVEPGDLLAQRHDLADDRDHRRGESGARDRVGERRERGGHGALRAGACPTAPPRPACRPSIPPAMSAATMRGSVFTPM